MQITATKIFFYLLIAAGVCFLLWYFSAIIGYLIMAAVLSLVANPLCRYIDNFKIYKGKSLSSSASAGITLVIVLIVMLGVVMVFVPAVVNEIKTLSNLDREQLVKNIDKPLSWMETTYNDLNIGSGRTFNQYVSDNAKAVLDNSTVTGFVSSFFISIGDVVAGIFSVLFISFFFLRDETLLIDSILSVTPKKDKTKAKKIFNESKQQLVSYLTALLLQFVIVTILCSAGMWIVGASNPLLLGLMFGLLNLIPYIGPLIAGVLCVVLEVSSNLHLDSSYWLMIALKVIAVTSVVQFIDNWFLSNYLFSRSVKAHPIEIFLVILVGSTVGGVVGMIVAIPVYSIGRIIFRELRQNLRKKEITIE